MIANTFPTINGVFPYEKDSSTPYFEVTVTNTPYTVKSRGPTSAWYVFPTATENGYSKINSGYRKWVANSPFVKLESGKSFPSEIAPNFSDGDQFTVVYSGYYQLDTTGATLFLYGKGRVTVYENAVLAVDNKQLSLTAPVTFHLPSNDRTLSIAYTSEGKKTESENIFLAKIHDANTYPEPIPLSAGHFMSALDRALGIGSYKINYINDPTVRIENKTSTLFTFSVPLAPASGVYGYRYNPTMKYYQDVSDSTNILKRYTMVEYTPGYKVGSTISTVTRFTGQIRNFKVVRNESSDILEVSCYDWLSFLGDAVNEGYPTKLDYIQHGYVDKTDGVAGDTKPRTYDAWKVKDALANLMYNAVIDPKVVYGKKKFIDVSGNVVEGGYLLEEIDKNTKLRLDKNFRYGLTFDTARQNSDDKYIWQFSVGDKLLSNFQEIADNFGFRYGCKYDGNVFVEAVKVPKSYKSIDSMSFSTFWTEWSEVLDVNSAFGVHIANKSSAAAVATFQGVNFSIISNVGPNYGTLDVRVSNTTLGNVFTASINLYNPATWQYNKGYYPELGYNPAVFTPATTLPYGVYSINFSTTGSCSINAIKVHEHSYYKNEIIVSTSDTTTKKGTVLTYDNNIDFNSLRNDVVVVGNLLGVKSYLMVEDGEQVQRAINPNNPISNHIVSRALDRASIGSVSSSNYTGRKLQTIIIEPKIATQKRADWLAAETINRYNSADKLQELTISIPGNPLIELGTKIGVKETKLNTVTPTLNSFWVDSITEKFSGNKYDTTLRVKSFNPWESYSVAPAPNLSRYNNRVIHNVTTKNTGFHPYNDYTTLTVSGTGPDSVVLKADIFLGIVGETQATLLTTQDVVNMTPYKGQCRIGSEIFKYNTRTVSTVLNPLGGRPVVGAPLFQECNITLSGLSRGLYGTATVSFSSKINTEVELQVSPYMTEEGVAPEVSFDVVKEGFLQVGVKSIGIILDNWGNEDLPTDQTGWIYVKPGRYTWTWGMLDRVGSFNEINSGVFANQGALTEEAGVVPDDVGSASGQSWFDYGVYYDRYKAGQGYYVQNRKLQLFNQSNFYAHFKSFYEDTSVSGYTNILSGAKQIYSRLHRTGPAVPSTNRVLESINLRPSYAVPASLNGCALSTLGVSNDWGSVLSGDSTKHPFYYTGEENGGDGVIYSIQNLLPNVDRIATVKVRRLMYVLGQSYHKLYSDNVGGQSVTYEMSAYSSEVLEEDVTEFVTNVRGDIPTNIYIKPPTDISFVTSKIGTHMVEASTVAKVNNTPMPRIFYAVSHLHLFVVEATDVSGITSSVNFALFWIPPEYDSINSVPLSPFDGSVVKKVRLYPRGKDTEGKAFSEDTDRFITPVRNEEDTIVSGKNISLFTNGETYKHLAYLKMLGVTLMGEADGS